MDRRERISEKAGSFFDDLWARGDPWGLESSDFERARYARLIAMLDRTRYARVLEIGCGAGEFTRLLAPVADRLVALDISPKAIARARERNTDLPNVEFQVANVMEYRLEPEGFWDLIVLSETVYFLGWLYSFFEVGYLASQLFAATRLGGELLLANTQMDESQPLLLPWLIRSYRDLFVNLGFVLEAEEIFRGEKNGMQLEVLISLFTKPAPPDTAGDCSPA